MNRLGLIIQREYLSMVGKKSFILMTILIPILSIVLCGVLPIMLSQVKSDEKKVVAIVDHSADPRFAAQITDNEDFHFLRLQPSAGESLYESYETAGESLHALVLIPDSMTQHCAVEIFSTQSIGAGLERYLSDVIEPELRRQKVASFGIDSLESIIAQCDVDLTVRTVKWDEQGGENISSAGVSEIIGLCLAFLTYMFVLMYGAMIMNGVIEEKTNRIVEVIVSSCKPFELMLGKIVGVALVGLTQLCIWGVMLFGCSLILGVTMMPDVTELNSTMEQVSTLDAPSELQSVISMIMAINFVEIFVCFVLYFIGGYLLYASLFAAFGSAVDHADDASQFMTPIMIIMVFALYAGIFSIENPDGPLAWWCSMIPFTSPIVMMIRLPYDVPLWELILSVVLLLGFALGILYLAGRIYRTGILMYGKKYTVREILRWLKRS